MKVLLTGASGFIGRSIARALATTHEVVCVVRDGAQCTDAAHKIIWDLSAPTLPVLPERIDAVVHAAQSRRYRDFPNGALDAFRVNVASTAILADYACRAKARSFCLLSSGSVYEPYLGQLREGAALSPPSINGATKLAAEALLAPYAKVMHMAALRLFFPYGPGQTERLIPDLIERVRSGSEITIAGRGGLVLTPIHVEDVANVVRQAVEETWSGPVNVAGATPITLARIAQDIGRHMGKTPMIRRTSDRRVRVVPDISRLRSLVDVDSFLGWKDGLSQVLAHRHDRADMEPASNV